MEGIAKREILECISAYSRPIGEFSLSSQFMAIITPGNVMWITTSFISIENGKMEINERQAEVTVNNIAYWYHVSEVKPDIHFIYTLYSRLGIAIDKTREYYRKLLTECKDEKERYLFLSAQCVGIQKRYQKVKPDIDFETANNEMLETINEWFEKKLR